MLCCVVLCGVVWCCVVLCCVRCVSLPCLALPCLAPNCIDFFLPFPLRCFTYQHSGSQPKLSVGSKSANRINFQVLKVLKSILLNKSMTKTWLSNLYGRKL